MPSKEIDLHPVSHIMTDAIGPAGKRIFYLQGWKEDRTITLIVEKFQIQSLAVGFEQFMAELSEKYPELPEATGEYEQEKMQIHPPVDPLFRVGEMGLGYDTDDDLVILVTREIKGEDQEDGEAQVVRFWCTRSQMSALCNWGMEVASQGRPLCPQCGEPMGPEGHFCPKKNGNKS